MDLSQRQAAFAAHQRVARLATADAQGRPHAVPVCFVYLDGRFYTPIDEKPKRSMRLKRLRNIEVNPQVALVFDEYSDDWSRLGWVMVQGRADVLDGGEEHAAAVQALRQKYEQYRPMALEGRPLIRVRPERVASWGTAA
ncbi:MAG: TIGR03668 family PPOX class F420-dependent oxidoreductase [Chloroflexi bacterium]|nr:TIGR03668 family PPOX class F420-dependent oxidoreductase [Chloroflexota bacterium]